MDKNKCTYTIIKKVANLDSFRRRCCTTFLNFLDLKLSVAFEDLVIISALAVGIFENNDF